MKKMILVWTALTTFSSFGLLTTIWQKLWLIPFIRTKCPPKNSAEIHSHAKRGYQDFDSVVREKTSFHNYEVTFDFLVHFPSKVRIQIG